MSTHVFLNIATAHGIAANNRGENAGNTTTLQKLIWHGRTHTTVSAEAVRFAVRERLGQHVNRTFNRDTRVNEWQDPDFMGWADKKKGVRYADDDILGFMKAEGAKEENEKGSTAARRAVLEVTRSVSLTPWGGDLTFNAASPGATPSAQRKGTSNPVPYATEMHATRYQFGAALTPEQLDDPSRAKLALEALRDLRRVAGNHGRFLYDFSPEAAVIRVTDDPAPRLLYCFGTADGGETLHADALVARVKGGDIAAEEIVIGGPALSPAARSALAEVNITPLDGVRQVFARALEMLGQAPAGAPA